MHLLQTTSATLDDIVEPRDLGQTPGDIVVLSFADSDLSGLATAYATEDLPTLRLAHLRDLRHPMSIDLWIDKVGRHAKVIVVRLLGGLDWWRYGLEALSAMAREHNIALAVLPGEDRNDKRLDEASTLPPDDLAALLSYFREGGRENLRALLRRLAGNAGLQVPAVEPQTIPRRGGYLPGTGVVALDELQTALPPSRPVVPVLFYRAALLAADTAPIDALCEALTARGLSPTPLFVPSLKNAEASVFVRDALQRLAPAAIPRPSLPAGTARPRRSMLFTRRCCKR
jgi:cobaltochelatase CobN